MPNDRRGICLESAFHLVKPKINNFRYRPEKICTVSKYRKNESVFICTYKYIQTHTHWLKRTCMYIIYIYIYIYTLGAESFASRKIRESFAFREHKLSRIGQNRIFRVLNFREWTEKLIFFVVVLRKRLDPDRNKREKTLLFQTFVVLGLVFVQQIAIEADLVFVLHWRRLFLRQETKINALSRAANKFGEKRKN